MFMSAAIEIWGSVAKGTAGVFTDKESNNPDKQSEKDSNNGYDCRLLGLKNAESDN